MPSELGNGVEKSFDASVLKHTIQQAPTGQGAFYNEAATALFFVAQAADEITAWGTAVKLRDQQLREFITAEPLFASALGIVCSRNAAFSWTIEGPPRATARMQRVLASANFGRGWADLMAKVSVDLYTQDAGAFVEVIRDGDSESAAVIGLAHLDSLRCYHTGLPETPVVYLDRNGAYHYLKWFQVLTLAEMPATYEGLPGIQYCALTRMLRAVRILRDVSIYLSEKIGGRNARAVTLVKGVTPAQIEEAWGQARAKHDSAGFLRFSQPIMIGAVDPKSDLGFETLELASLPDGFDLDLTFKQYVAQIAMAFTSDYQEFAPLPGGNLGTSSQSEILHLKTRGKGPGLFMKLIEQAINWTVFSDDMEFKFDEADPEADLSLINVSKLRADERAVRIQSGELTPEAARQMAHEAGDLSTELLEMMKAQDVVSGLTVTDTNPADTDEVLDETTAPDTPGAGGVTATPSAPNSNKPATFGAPNTKEKDAPLPVGDKRLLVEDEVQAAIEQAFEEAYARLTGGVA